MRIGIMWKGAMLLIGLVTAVGCGDKGGGDGGGASGKPSCAAYCASMQANCTGANQQYTTSDNCLNSCKAMPVGEAADKSGNTLGCRSYHANAAATDAILHCPHAGPGGDGVCGSVCDGYCQIAEAYCTTANGAQIYTDHADCESDCQAHHSDLRFNVSIQDGDEQACLLYHVQEASTVPADHCNGDLAKTSPSCKVAGGG